MTGEELTVICGDGKVLKIPKDKLRENCDYFRAMFDSQMSETQVNFLDLRSAAWDLRPGEGATLFRRRVLREIFLAAEFQPENFWTKTAQRMANKNVTVGRHCDVGDLLFAAGYFQASGWIEKLKNSGRHSCMSVSHATQVMPYARQYGLLEIQDIAEKTAAVNYTEFLGLCGVYNIEKSQREAIERFRFGRSLAQNVNFTVILQTDVCLDEMGYLRRSYALVNFQQNENQSINWSPKVVDTFTLRQDESIVQALTLHNYLYIVTSQYCWRMRRTRIRIFSFNPFLCHGEPTSDPSKVGADFPDKNTQLGMAWKLETDELTKSGYVQSFKASVITSASSNCKEPRQAICLHSAQRVSRRKSRQYKALSDVDYYEPVARKWKSMSKASLQKLTDSSDEGLAPHIVGPTQQADSHFHSSHIQVHCDVTHSNDVTNVSAEVVEKYTTIQTKEETVKSKETSAPPVCDNADASDGGEVCYRLTVDKTLRSDGDIVSLRRLGDAPNGDVLYRIARTTVGDNSEDLTEVEKTLADSSIAVPRLFNLFYPNC
uniref:Uncharacterized protein LOC108949722 n=1 Tax=Phallusia mammillata TaxID=59560 RepID=A0A6F9DIL2_9ASCI|nr:uncharacterized protein LOC108949722 [Phallusia mammillata]